ncbi:unnamed protein product [Protopolystoma xenopodis]|uniref:Otopetrin n=1 Tax=Protopolystoma xenopodis TaxID=117903 RepID=A0A3S5CH55_9PLAT|nr:unnamed protein product [Protopolystoma xenopodis]
MTEILIQSLYKKERYKRQQACRGLVGNFVGLLLCLTVLVITLYLELNQDHNSLLHYRLHSGEVMFIYLVTLGLTLVAFGFTLRLKFTVHFTPHSLDEKLLVVTYFVTVNYQISSIAMCLHYLSQVNLVASHQTLLQVGLVARLVELAQASLQTFFIQDAFYRCSQDEATKHKKPGRDFIAILLAVNFSLWMIKSFQV